MSLHRPFEECPKTWKTPFWCWEGVFQHLRDIIGSSKFYQIFQKVFKIDACNTSWGLLRASKECPKTWKTPSQCWHGVLNHFGLIVPSFIKFSTNLLKWCPRHSLGLSQGLWKMPKSLKNTLLLPRGCFSKYWTHHIWFCASLWSPFYISFNHNMWFFWTHHHLSCKGSCPRLFSDCPCKFKGVFVALVVWFGSVFGRQPRGLIGLMACTPK